MELIYWLVHSSGMRGGVKGGIWGVHIMKVTTSINIGSNKWRQIVFRSLSKILRTSRRSMTSDNKQNQKLISQNQGNKNYETD